jgi:hypothetical protein
MPVRIDDFPDPSMFRLTEISVSLVVRLICARRRFIHRI